MKKLSVLGLVAGAALMCAIPVSFHWSPAQTPSLSVDKANAVIGRPLTPGSVQALTGECTGVHIGMDTTTEARD